MRAWINAWATRRGTRDKTQERWISKRVGWNNREISKEKNKHSGGGVPPCIKILILFLKKNKAKQNKFLFSPITKWHLEFPSARREKEREARGLWCQEHIGACLRNHRNLWMESTGSHVWAAAVVREKKQPYNPKRDSEHVKYPARVTLRARARVRRRAHAPAEWFHQLSAAGQPLLLLSASESATMFTSVMTHDGS